MPVVSASWKASLPIRCVGTWPVSRPPGWIHQRIGEARHRIGGAGTGVTSTTPTLAGRAGIALGGMTAACSWRTRMWRIWFCLNSAS